MKFNRLGNSDLQVSDVCLGTMTWGIQNTQQDADEQMAFALDKGVNFVDTAEMYIPMAIQSALSVIGFRGTNQSALTLF